MGLTDEFKRCRDWVAHDLHVERATRDVSFFETTIRVLGGLLSAYDLSKDRVFLDKAREVGDRLLPAFNTPSGLPRSQVNLATGRSSTPDWTGGAAILAEIGTVQLEFAYLSHHTGIAKYGAKAAKVMDVMSDANKPDGLFPIYVDVTSGRFTTSHVTFGALGDSFYEYLIKQWVM